MILMEQIGKENGRYKNKPIKLYRGQGNESNIEKVEVIT